MLRYIFNFLFLLSSLGTWAQQSVATKVEAAQLKKKMLDLHVSPKPVDDSFSEFVFDHFLETIDPDKCYFTEKDITALAVYKTKIDDELSGTGWDFLPAITQLYRKALLRAEGMLTQYSNTSFDYTTNEIFVSSNHWADSDAEHARRWYLNLKIETLDQLIRLRRNIPDILETEFLHRKEPDARQLATRSAIRKIRRVLDNGAGYENYLAAIFLRSVTLGFDPHSSYFSFTEMQHYLASMSTEGFYFGISIEENEQAELVIGQLTPGGPAWRSGEIHPGDVIEQIRWEGQAWLDVAGMSKAEMEEWLQEPDRNSMELTLLQTGNIQKTIRLRKEKMQADENIVKSFILEGKKKIGYVSLPGFYSNWGEKEGARCANDVAKEILKLKKENIDGLILDVRYNGGGSLYEAVAMAGIFIDAGPMGILKDKAGNVQSVKDMNRGTVYDGPLAVVVNGLSASASEFFAAAMQDYRRAIVVGSRTYGKATGQEIIPMEPGKLKLDETQDTKSGWGYSTITTMKIYRITGKTAQQHGVVPDVVFPDLYDALEFREAYLKGALPADSVIKKTYYTPHDALPIQSLKNKSEARIAGNKAFQVTAQCSALLAQFKNKMDSVSLNWIDYNTLMEDETEEFKLLKEVHDKPTSTYAVSSHAFERQRMQVDEHAKQTNEVWMENLLRDVSLEEAFNIICDYIDTNSSK